MKNAKRFDTGGSTEKDEPKWDRLRARAIPSITMGKNGISRKGAMILEKQNPNYEVEPLTPGALPPTKQYDTEEAADEAAWKFNTAKKTEVKKGGRIHATKMAKGGSVKSSASKRGDGIAQRGKTRGRFV